MVTLAQPVIQRARTHNTPAAERHRTRYTAPMPKRVLVGIVSLRRELGALLAAVKADEHRVLARRNQVLAVLLPPTWYQQAQARLGGVVPWDMVSIENIPKQLRHIADAMAGELDKENPVPAKHVILTRYGQQVAVIAPIRWYRDACTAVGDPTEY